MLRAVSAGVHSARATLERAARPTARRAMSMLAGDVSTPLAARRRPPPNLGFVIVPQQWVYIVERLGKFNRSLGPGFHLLIPVLDNITYIHSLKEEAISIPNQMAITRDNVTINIDGVLYARVDDPKAASYGVENPYRALTLLAQTTMRSELGKLTLDKTFEERETLNTRIVHAINDASKAWGISCLRYEIRDINPPANVRKAMELQAEAERRKRATILDSEGDQQSEINIAEGQKAATILASEARQLQQINTAKGEADAIRLRAAATAEAVRAVSAAIASNSGRDAVALRVAEQYVEAFGKLAKEGNTVIIPADTANAGAMVAQAMAVFKHSSGFGSVPATNASPVTSESSEIDDDVPYDAQHDSR